MSFPIPPGITPFCQGKWDTEKQSFVPTSSIDVIQCCLDSCKDHPQFCFNLCDSTYKDPHVKKPCYEQCNELAQDCEDACYDLPSKGFDIISRCAEDKGCGKRPIFDVECLKNKYDDIITCCRESCIGDQSLDCDGHCDELYNLLVRGNTTSVKSVPVHKETEGEFNKQSSHTIAWVCLAFAVLLFILVVVVY